MGYSISIVIFVMTAIFTVIASISVAIYSFFQPDMNWGIYDPGGAYNGNQSFQTEAAYYDWNINPGDFEYDIKHIYSSQRLPLITLEPWPKPEDIQNFDYLKQIPAGEYDELIVNLCKVIGDIPGEVQVRWGHEMELTNSRYFWSNKNPDDYISAYRYFVEKCREHKNIKFVWSPAGDNGLEKYWPGDDYVDYIGISLYSYADWEISNHGYQRSFTQILDEKYDRIREYNKPIIIAEGGVTGNDQYKLDWLKKAEESFKRYRLLKTFVYFNSKDVEGVWGQDYQTPDWTINSKLLNEFFR